MTDYTTMNGKQVKNSTDGRRSLFVDISFCDGTLNASIVGPRIGEREATIVANAVNAKIKEFGNKITSLILDFTDVQFVSSLGLGMCIDVRNTAENCNAGTSIVGLTSHLKELFEMMRLDRLFRIQSVKPTIGTAA
jgi:anti-anti-sigma factor